MVVTVLEARVAPEKWGALEQVFGGGTGRMPSQMKEMFLVHDRKDPTIWRAIAIWRSAEALSEYQKSVQTPGGVLMFRSVGAEPTLAVYDVVVHGQAETDLPRQTRAA